MDEWNDVVVYTVPRRVDDKAIKVITLNPDHVVNNLGQTAAQVNALREEKRANGQMTASAKKLARSVGEQKALDTLSSIVTKISSMVALPRGAREVELLDNRGDTVLVEEMPNFLKSS